MLKKKIKYVLFFTFYRTILFGPLSFLMYGHTFVVTTARLHCYNYRKGRNCTGLKNKFVPRPAVFGADKLYRCLTKNIDLRLSFGCGCGSWPSLLWYAINIEHYRRRVFIIFILPVTTCSFPQHENRHIIDITYRNRGVFDML